MMMLTRRKDGEYLRYRDIQSIVSRMDRTAWAVLDEVYGWGDQAGKTVRLQTICTSVRALEARVRNIYAPHSMPSELVTINEDPVISSWDP